MAVHTKSLENGFYHSLLWQWGSGTYFLNVPKYLAVQGESIFHSPPPLYQKEVVSTKTGLKWNIERVTPASNPVVIYHLLKHQH